MKTKNCKMKIKHVRGILFSLSTMLSCLLLNKVHAQNTMPDHYFTFDCSNPLTDSLSTGTLNVSTYSCPYTIESASNGGVGKSMKLSHDGKIILISQFKPGKEMTIEFLFKPAHDFNTTQFISRKDNAFSIKMGYPFIQFNTSILSNSGSSISDNMEIELLGTGRSTYGYYTDGNWHHMVFKYNTATGSKEIWVDGQSPDGFSKTTAVGTFNQNVNSPSNNDVLINTNTSYYKLFGNIDELAIYTTSLSPNNIYKHYQDESQHHHYTFTNSTVPPPSPGPVTAAVDINEFAPGHPNYTVSAVDQLKNYPLPRYKTNHTLQPNFNWIAMRYLAGEFQPGVSYANAVANSVEIQKELAKNWNYYLMVSSNTSTSGQYNDLTKYHGAWVKLANDNPQWPTSAISFWAQLNPAAFGFTSSIGYIESKALPANQYLRNNAGQFIDLQGQATGKKYWSPSAPVDSFRNDGLTQRAQIQRLLNALTRPLNIISENGEVIPKMPASTMSTDPTIVQDKGASGISDWDTYLGNRKARVCMTYRDQFMNLPQLANTKYTEYQISGHPTARHKYSETRFINKTSNGQHYATPDFYPRWPKNWETGTGAWNGWQHIIDGRSYEIQSGDKLFSPFVAAGWNNDEERNIRPAQWLGLLKCMGMLGAECYYAGFFNEAASYLAPNPPPANPAGYVWQASIPSYAQAITSRYEDLLRNGDLMPGDKPNSYTNPTAPGYSFEAGDARKLVVIRKHHTDNIYAITGTIQPNSNMQGNAETDGDALITLDGKQLQFKIRRQGSTYIYDNRNPSAPVFYQLDGWHEASHPYLWSKDFNFEAELSDNNSGSFNIMTEKTAATTAGDFRNATSYISFNGSNTPLQYNFQPRTNANLYLWVRARSVHGATTGLNVAVNGANQKSIGCISDSTWKWYSMDACLNQAIVFNTTAQAQQLTILPTNNSLEIDKILLTPNASIILNSNQPSCSGIMATINASGPTNFCNGDSVKLTASAGVSYLWSNGKTTQSITVTTSGTYSVTVVNNTSCAGTSAPVTVTVANLNVANITASGPTSFCKGGSVELTSPVANTYLWSNGATTKTIHVDSTGNYMVTISNGIGCSGTSAITAVTVNNLPTITIAASGPLQILPGQSVTFTASGGTNYIWTPGGATSSSITVNTAGIYHVTGFNANGCQANSDSLKVTVNVQLIANITATGNQYLCPGDTMTLTSDPAYSYKWMPGAATTKSIKVTQAGSYQLTIFDAYGNSASKTFDAISATLPPTPTISINYIPNAGYQLTANTPSAASYIWSNGQTTSSINVTTPSTYSVIAISSFGCKSAKTEMNIGSITGQPCGKADMLTTFDIIDTAATIGWNPAVTGDSFEIKYWADGSSAVQTVSIPGNISSFRLANLNPGTLYKWKIQTNCLNLQKLSDVKSFTTLSSALPCGSIPSNMSATDITPNSAQLNWYNTTANSFKIRYRPAGTVTYSCQTFDGVICASGGKLSALTPNTLYEWCIQSRCGTVNTSYSQPSYFTTADPCSYLGKITITSIGTSSATVRWCNHSPLDTIRIKLITASTGNYRYVNIIGTPNPGEFTFHQLKPNTAYFIQIKGKCSGGVFGLWSSKIPFMTQPVTSRDGQENTFELSGYPNPASDVLSYSFNSDKKENYTLKICDLSGRELFQEVRNAEDGSNGDMIDVKRYPTGLYLLIMQKGAQASHFTFAVQDTE